MKEPPLELLKETLPGYMAHWTYMEHGRATIAVARYHDYKGEKTFRQFVNQQGEWKMGLPSSPYPLYGLESLSLVSPFNAIFICEGERKAALLHKLAWPAMSSMLGAESVEKSDFSPLRYFKEFIILRDNDAAGIHWTKQIASALKRQDPDCIMHICNLCPESNGADVIDWVAKYPLYGWDGFSQLNQSQIEVTKSSLQAKILESKKLLEDCKDVSYNSSSRFFFFEPKPLVQKLKPVLKFPIECLKESIRDYLTTLAKQKSLPVDVPATIFLTLLGGVIGRRVQLKMRPTQGWRESANVWTALIAPPSFKKSPSLRELFNHITLLESMADKEFKKAQTQHDANQNKKTNESPIRRRFVTDDCTTPKLRELFSQNPGGIILRNDELKGMLKKLDTIGYESDRSFILSCWPGLDFYNEDRMIRGSNLSIPLTLTWIGCIPPTGLLQYLQQAISDGGGSDGLMQRFQMPCYPDFDLPFELCNEIISSEIEQKIQNLFFYIDTTICHPWRVLSFSSEAQLLVDPWVVNSENDARLGGHPSYWASHIGKIPKLLGSLCIILHCIKEAISGCLYPEISSDTFSESSKLVEYYLSHAKRCYESVEGFEVATARKIIELIKHKKLNERFKAYEIYGNGLGGLTSSRTVREALYFLQEAGLVALDRTQCIGRPIEDWIAHPNIRQNPLF